MHMQIYLRGFTARGGLKFNANPALAINGIKLLVLPTLVWLIIIISWTSGIVPATFLIFAALPTASAAHLLAARYGADRGRVAIVVMQSSITGLLTLPLWTALASTIAAR